MTEPQPPPLTAVEQAFLLCVARVLGRHHFGMSFERVGPCGFAIAATHPYAAATADPIVVEQITSEAHGLSPRGGAVVLARDVAWRLISAMRRPAKAGPPGQARRRAESG